MIHQPMESEEPSNCGMEFCPQKVDLMKVENNNNNNHYNRDSFSCQCPRKRKEHDDDLPDMKEGVGGQDCKYSKSDDKVGRFMINWIRRDPEEILDDHQANTQDQPRSEHITNWSWLHRQRRCSSKENSEPVEEDRWSPASGNIPERFISPPKYLEENNQFKDKQKSDSKTSPKTSKKILKKLSAIESKIEEAGAEFEAKTGYRLSMADKMKDAQLRNLKLEQVHLRLKQDMKNSKEVKKEESISRTRRFSIRMSAEEDRDKMVQNMQAIRHNCNRPFQLELMTLEQMIDEKMDLQRHLADYEKVHGLQGEQKDKNIMADLYERNRLLLRQTRRQSLKSDQSVNCVGDLDIIPEDESVSLTISSQGQRQSLELGRRRSWSSFATGQKRSRSSVDTSSVTGSWQHLPLAQLFTDNKETSVSEESSPVTTDSARTILANQVDESVVGESPYHTMSREDLASTLKRMKDEKKMYRKQISNYQKKVKEEMGRKVPKEEKEDLEAYKLYKDVKCKIKLVDALLSKYSVVILDR